MPGDDCFEEDTQLLCGRDIQARVRAWPTVAAGGGMGMLTLRTWNRFAEFPEGPYAQYVRLLIPKT